MAGAPFHHGDVRESHHSPHHPPVTTTSEGDKATATATTSSATGGAAPTPSPTPPRVIADKYEVVGVLGEGGTGIVYDAITLADRKPVALKVMHEAFVGDKQIRGRFQREAAILRRLEGAHICPILDAGEVPGADGKPSLLYIALPKIDGPSLAELLSKEVIDVDRALDIVLEVLSALKSAHAQGVIHRDLKPANVLLRDGKHVIVVDFGMSKIVTGGGLGTTNLTTHNMVFGTPEYMSPEQARGDDLDARCDIYAAGVMLYEMLTGSPPFTGATPLNVLTAHLTSDLEPPSKRPKAATRVSPAIERVIMNALARDRDERYASAAELTAAIIHARAAPDDVISLRPAAFGAAPPGMEAFAVTIPASTPPEVSGSQTGDRESTVDANAATLLGDKPAFRSGPPPKISVKPSTPPPSSTPKAIPSKPPPEPPSSTKTWVIVWVLVGLVSIGVGVYFALKP
jgi:eukaryotic-like serine/threonine-protein kinase